ncbi:MAG: RNA-binding transcriptional accessory protein [Planctomycetes bacterium]|nr:RNA-binding transcriptional accessory protein [Planctomycetota bacterium]
MNIEHIKLIAEELDIKLSQVEATAKLLSEDATVPFIARYRKEATGSLDEVQIAAIRDRLAQLEELDKRREAILKSLSERELLTNELEKAVKNAQTMSELEDIYLPYKPKRRTRATIAREKGLESLALYLLEQDAGSAPEAEAEKYVNAELNVESTDDALAGARDIIAEIINEDSEIRKNIRELFSSEGTIASTVAKDKEESGAKFRDYFEWTENVAKAPSHRILAMFRGENEEVLKLAIRPDEGRGISELVSKYVKSGPAATQVALAAEDCYKRLLAPSMENEIRGELKKVADEEAIRVFADNLRELLMAPPLGRKAVLGLDPGFRTGCKVVCLDAQGKLLYDTVIYVTHSQKQKDEAGAVVCALCQKYGIEAVAIGNGTASRETEAFIRSLGLPKSISIMMVNESGASIYSASEVAREEFPDHDVTVRGSVSIARRLMDPLAELVKIDPKSIGVGQYQHDVDQSMLKKSLDDVVESCVNRVGVEVNTASKQLLTYVSGLGPVLAGNIVKHRDEKGPFKTRKDLLKVTRLGPKAFEQAAGFLRINDSKNPLDSSAVHPESYDIVNRMADDIGCKVNDLMSSAELRNKIKLDNYISDKVGLPTLVDIMDELARPGRDPRDKFEAFAFADGVNEIKDLAPGMKLPGIVTNVTNFGAFVDIGVHQDGLVHISELSDEFVNNPADVVKVQQKVQVTVLEIDEKRNRISLSMKTNPGAERAPMRESNRGERSESGKRQGSKPIAQPKKQEPSSGSNWFTKAMKKS